MEKISREQMIQMAKETRKKVTNAIVPDEEMEKYPVNMKKMLIPTRVGDAEAYYSYKESCENGDVLVINFHGGGFIRERTPNDELFCRKLNHELGCKVLDVDYKIAPDHPYPTAVYETYDVVQWVYKHREEFGVEADKILLSGHSAGGNLAIVDTMIAKAEHTYSPAMLIIDYPPLDLYTDPGEKPCQGEG
ncbi:MAG: steryl acetyl hydrolase, partial [Clostridia bacterium]|nr:steryl acetyl hydrolase [Clostridia bacterium]